VPQVVIDDGLGSDTQQVFKLVGAGPLKIGRADDSAAKIVSSSSVSGVHAIVECFGDVWTIKDGNGVKPSSNGTFLRGVKSQSGTLRDGDDIRFGKVVVIFQTTLALPAKKRLDPPPTSSSSSSALSPLLPARPAARKARIGTGIFDSDSDSEDEAAAANNDAGGSTSSAAAAGSNSGAKNAAAAAAAAAAAEDSGSETECSEDELLVEKPPGGAKSPSPVKKQQQQQQQSFPHASASSSPPQPARQEEPAATAEPETQKDEGGSETECEEEDDKDDEEGLAGGGKGKGKAGLAEGGGERRTTIDPAELSPLMRAADAPTQPTPVHAPAQVRFAAEASPPGSTQKESANRAIGGGDDDDGATQAYDAIVSDEEDAAAAAGDGGSDDGDDNAETQAFLARPSSPADEEATQVLCFHHFLTSREMSSAETFHLDFSCGSMVIRSRWTFCPPLSCIHRHTTNFTTPLLFACIFFNLGRPMVSMSWMMKMLRSSCRRQLLFLLLLLLLLRRRWRMTTVQLKHTRSEN
jgi:hypothetical protein